ncbi:MAG: FG-GAP-like repeat-containing protein [Myxococcota bacterium]
MVAVHFGTPPLAPGTARTAAPATKAPFAWTGSADQRLGAGAAAAGDVNGDHLADLLVSDARGALDLYLGPPSYPVPVGAWSEPATGPLVGFGAAGDANGDGFGDVWTLRDGKLRIYLGPDLSTVLGPPGGTTASPATAWIGDVDGRGRSQVVSLADALALAAAGDMNGDGFADAIVRWPDALALDLGGPAGLREVARLRGGTPSLRPATSTATASATCWRCRPPRPTSFGAAAPGSGRPRLPCAGRPWPQRLLAGLVVAGVGDFDGNGLDDVLRGDPGEGRIRVYLNDGERGYRQSGDTDPELGALGAFAAAVGDVDGNGVSDVVVGAPGHRHLKVPEVGRVRILYAHSDGETIPLEKTDWTAEGLAAQDHFGRSVAAAGDMNGDGYADFIAGAPDAQPAYAVVFLGDPDLPREALRVEVGVRADAEAGWVGAAGDFNFDSYSDVVIGAPGDARMTVVWGARQGPRLDAEPGVFSGIVGWGATDPRLRAGRVLAALAPSALNPFAQLVTSASACTEIEHSPRHLFGFTEGRVRCFGRLDSRETDNDPLTVGGDTLTPSPWSPELGCFGAALAAVGDTDGDGAGDLVVAAPGADDGVPDRDLGRLVAYRGSPAGCVLPAPVDTWVGDRPDERLGQSLAGAGDLDGDGFADVVASAETLAPPSPNAELGGLFVLRGNGAFGPAAFPSRIHAWRIAEPTPIPPGGRTGRAGSVVPGAAVDPRTSFLVTGRGRSPFGPMRVRLEVEVKPWNLAFDGQVIHGDWVAGELAARERALSQVVSGLLPGQGYHWRARIAYDPSTAAPQPASPWTSGGHAMLASTVEVRALENLPPVALPQTFDADGGLVLLARPGLLADSFVSDPDDAQASLRVVTSQPEHGEAHQSDEGAFVYEADPGFFGTDRFTYTVRDPWGQEAEGNVTVNVTPIECLDTSFAQCDRGDFRVVVELADGTLKSARCWITDAFEVDCDTTPDGALALGPPSCGLVTREAP